MPPQGTAAMRSGSLTLADLPGEIHLELFKHLEPWTGGADMFGGMDPQQIRAKRAAIAMLCLVSKQFNQVATPQLYRNITLSNYQQIILLMRTLCRQKELSKNVRYLFLPASFKGETDGPGWEMPTWTVGQRPPQDSEHPLSPLIDYMSEHYVHAHDCPTKSWIALKARTLLELPRTSNTPLLVDGLRQTILYLLLIRVPALQHLHLYVPPGRRSNVNVITSSAPTVFLDSLRPSPSPTDQEGATPNGVRQPAFRHDFSPHLSELTFDLGGPVAMGPSNYRRTVHPAWHELMALPSITKINLIGVGGSWFFGTSGAIPRNGEVLRRQLELTNLRIMKFCVGDFANTTELGNLFKLAHRLETLLLYRPVRVSTRSFLTEPAGPHLNLSVDLLPLRSTLKSLNLQLMLPRKQHDCSTNTCRVFGSFTKWSRLKHLTVNLQALVGDLVAPGPIAEVDFWNMFPPSLKRLDIYGWLPRRSEVAPIYESPVTFEPLCEAFAKLRLQDASPTTHNSATDAWNATTSTLSSCNNGRLLNQYQEGLLLFFRRLMREVAMKPGMELRVIRYHLIEKSALDTSTISEIKAEFARCGVRFSMHRTRVIVKASTAR
ncbi:hypothetical protein B0T19DRAFT_401621 [Cercophora scortea]|uniref:F-box domain-containing protein n=1 Tax=Cercophora scortea TaxID=314031 RepID=A0AAE0M8Y2_9PEZI|nr:hypothetical protein B0T19DRAFT_401621 [Cercophora scortea]